MFIMLSLVKHYYGTSNSLFKSTVCKFVQFPNFLFILTVDKGFMAHQLENVQFLVLH